MSFFNSSRNGNASNGNSDNVSGNGSTWGNMFKQAMNSVESKLDKAFVIQGNDNGIFLFIKKFFSRKKKIFFDWLIKLIIHPWNI